MPLRLLVVLASLLVAVALFVPVAASAPRADARARQIMWPAAPTPRERHARPKAPPRKTRRKLPARVIPRDPAPAIDEVRSLIGDLRTSIAALDDDLAAKERWAGSLMTWLDRTAPLAHGDLAGDHAALVARLGDYRATVAALAIELGELHAVERRDARALELLAAIDENSPLADAGARMRLGRQLLASLRAQVPLYHRVRDAALELAGRWTSHVAVLEREVERDPLPSRPPDALVDLVRASRDVALSAADVWRRAGTTD